MDVTNTARTPSADAGAIQAHCPLCDRLIKKPHKAKTLHGVRVCRKCRNAFANLRQAAYIVDGVLWYFAAAAVVYLLEAYVLGPQGDAPVVLTLFGLGSAGGFVDQWILPLIFFCKDGFSGASPGKRLCGVQVVDTDTREPISFGRSFKRNLVLVIPFGFLGVMLTMMKGRRWGDKWANTTVIWSKYAFKLPFDPRGVLCTKCGYDLTGNVSGRCPECFTPIPDTPQGVPCTKCGYDLTGNVSGTCPECATPVPWPKRTPTPAPPATQPSRP